MVRRYLSPFALIGSIALAMASVACASTAAAPRPFPTPASAGRAEPPAGPSGEAVRSASTGAIVDTALGLRGAPYREGGTTPEGFDCSGFTQWVFARHGLHLPREVRDQFSVGDVIDAGEVQPGDLLFFSTEAPGASHVAIALGGDAFVHAPSSRGVVRVERLTLPYWSRRFLGVRRLVAD